MYKNNKSLNEILIKYFGSGLSNSTTEDHDAYEELVELLYEVGDLAEAQTVIKGLIKRLDEMCNRNSSKNNFIKSLEEILIDHFKSGFPFPEAPCCESYEKLIGLLYDVANLVEINVENLVETLDSICTEDSVRDENGELVYDYEQAKEILAERAEDD